MKGALGCKDNEPSISCLSSSLRIAIHLTQQIIDIEELSKVGLSSGLESLPSPRNTSCRDWVNCIVVGVNTYDEIDSIPLQEASEQVTAAAIENLPDAVHDLQNLDEMCDRAELLDLFSSENKEDEEIDVLIVEGESHQQDHIDYHSVCFAHISTSNSQNNMTGSEEDYQRDKQYRIYSLGLVLYELFGCKEPPPEMLIKDSPHGLTNLSIGSVDEDESDYLQPGPYKRRSSNSPLATRRSSNSSLATSLSSGSPAVTCNVNVEDLRMLGIPNPLCDLIRNMIDAVNGDFIRSETYVEMSDVKCDLQLMLDKPDVYLRGVDVGKLSGASLILDETLFDRGEEFRSLQSAYHRSLLKSSELVIISGVSGTGKSTLSK